MRTGLPGPLLLVGSVSCVEALPPVGILVMARQLWPFFVAGALVGPRLCGRGPITGRPARVGAVLGAGGLLAGVGLVVDYGPWPDSVSPDLLTRMMGTAAVVLLVLAVAESRLARGLAALGRHTLEIYLVHVYGTAGMRIALLRGLGVTDQFPHVALGMLAGVLLPLGLARLARSLHADWLFRLPASRRPGVASRSPIRASRPERTGQLVGALD